MNSDILESLLVSTHRLTRVAAQATGSTTPSAQWRTLSILEADGPMRIGELAAASRVTQPGMTRLLATMVEEELVSRIADRDDSRAWLIVVTKKGAQALADWRAQLAQTLEPWFGELSDDDWATLASAASLLQANLGTDSAAVAS
ncbi:MarR family winged helix-turn-helix transcriptional regulator [Protaetiibacter mangrovi]|uniref:MarR family transcriptional regulator n=1 Tax=Protaetiibacter mangrovi TaxID=2970926 RepID=A0ABT1ZEB9_9MICO|nr:MarR family transcriptional regulator [Protaetiibacter mangrovi]MCS0499047.1 MarR family transcriptional regulator [Protaetiibacter mangrovi]TPW94207.1 MarR family transcriptional regulator [Schumannella luteola]